MIDLIQPNLPRIQPFSLSFLKKSMEANRVKLLRLQHLLLSSSVSYLLLSAGRPLSLLPFCATLLVGGMKRC